MKIAVVGGTGLVGQGILLELSKDTTLELHSISRNGKRPNSIAGVNYHSFDLAHFVPKPLIYLFDDFYISFTFFLLAEQF